MHNELATDPKKPEEDSLPVQARKSFDRLVEGWATIKDRAGECMKCLSKDGPWPDNERKARSLEGQERPCIHEDVLGQYVNKVINQAQGNPIGIEVSPDGDGATPESAEFTENRIRHIDYESNAVHARESALESAVQQGVGIWEVGTDWEKPPQGPLEELPDLAALFRQKIITIPAVDPWNYVLDCDAIKPDWSDMKEAFKLRWFTHEEFRQKFHGALIQDFTGLINTDTSRWMDDHRVQVAEWWRVEPSYRDVLLLKSKNGVPQAVFADQFDESEIGSLPVIEKRKVETCRVMKRLTNGVEMLGDEIEWPDYEIPILVTTGRVKYENGVRVIDSLIGPAISGALLHDYIVSAIQEEINRAVKTKAWGAEGSFDSSTEWNKLHREPTTYAEYVIVYDKNGNAVPPPQMIESNPQIAALLAAKQSNLIDIQNMIGMSSTERVDRVSKSGIAQQELKEEIQVNTYHYTNSWKMAIEREGRIKERLLNKIEPKTGKVSLRNPKGEHQMADMPDGVYSGRHTVVISTGKAYKNQQEEIRDVGQQLTKSNDPMVQQAAWPMLLRAMNLGPQIDALADELEAVQPLPMQQARSAKTGKGPDPAQQLAQAQQQLKMIQEHMGEVIALSKKQAQMIDAKVIENDSRKEIAIAEARFNLLFKLADLKLKKYQIDMSRENTLITAKTSAASDAAAIESEHTLTAEQHALEFDLARLDHLQGKDAASQQHDQTRELTSIQNAHDAGQGDIARAHEADMAAQAAAQQESSQPQT